MPPKQITTIVHTWLDHELASGKTKAEALRALNSALGTAYKQNRLYEWLNGKHEPQRDVRVLMLSVCLPSLLTQLGLSKKLTAKQVRDLADKLT